MSILDALNTGDELAIKADSCLGYSFKLREVFEGTDGRIFSFDASDKSRRLAESFIWGFAEVSLAGFEAKGLLKRNVNAHANA